jgi:excisionase family DNA binding protein
MKIDPEDLLTVSEAARLRGVSHQSISYLVKMGRVRSVSIRGRTYILRKDLENYKPGKPGPPPRKKAKSRSKKPRKKPR